MPGANDEGLTAAIILAAGASRRMGRNKLLLRIGGETLVRRAVARATAAGMSPVIVVLGHDPDSIRHELAGLSCQFVANPDYFGPTGGSLHRGLEALPDRVGSAVVMLADMPMITVEMLQSMVARARNSPAPAVASRYGDVLAPPLLFRRSLFAELLAWQGEGCGKQVVLRHQDEAIYLDWPVEALADIDTPGDLEILLRPGA